VVCAAALANLDIIEREGLIARARKLAPYFARRLGGLARHAIVGEVRTAGLMGALELVRDKRSKEPLPASSNVAARIRQAALARGVIVRASADTVVVCPPLIIKPAEIDRIAATLDEAIAEVSAELATAELRDISPLATKRPNQ
jgi:adenosylmethionine-8-amino-7-oxononanoate aminotransferase